MSVAAKAELKGMSDAEVVEAYLTASMIPDPDAASAYMKPGTIITFTGGREFDHPRGPTGFNARRYRWVKKKMDRFDVCPGADETVERVAGCVLCRPGILRALPHDLLRHGRCDTGGEIVEEGGAVQVGHSG